jgi:opacity protein-like surface antigen
MQGSRWMAGLFLLLSAACAPAGAQEQLKLFVGYSYLRPSVTYDQASACPLGCPSVPNSVTTHPNLNGYEFSAAYKILPFVGLTADFSGHYGTVTGSSSGHVQTYLFGPELAFPAKVSPFVHALVGVGHQAVGAGTSTSSGVPVDILSSSDTAFATALGAGIDLHIAVSFLSRDSDGLSRHSLPVRHAKSAARFHRHRSALLTWPRSKTPPGLPAGALT